MNAKWRRIVRWICILVAVQAAAVVLYVAKRRPVTTGGSTFEAEMLTPRPAPELVGDRRDGTRVSLATLRGKAVMVHFWATWCKPCRHELPGLLATTDALAKSGRFELIAVTVDDDWDEVASFFGGKVPAAIVRPHESDVHARFGASTLPDTYLVDAQGRLVTRYAGARDWTSSIAEQHLDDMLARMQRQ